MRLDELGEFGLIDRVVARLGAAAATDILVPPGDAGALADALVRALSDAALAERLGTAAREAVSPWLATPEEYARRLRDLVEKVAS